MYALALTLLVVSQPAPRDAAWEPAPRAKEYPWMSIDTWKKLHAGHLERTKKGGVDVVFLGDSITQEEAVRAAERDQLRDRRGHHA